jgi:hypothetical protein
METSLSSGDLAAAENELTFFSDRDDALQLISHIVSPNWRASFETKFDALSAILVKYLEQPLLLNPSLGLLLEPPMTTLVSIGTIARDEQATGTLSSDRCRDSLTHLHAVSKVIHLICRVRGFKHVTKLFPHEVAHFELCITLLKLQVMDDGSFKSFLSH